MKVEPKEKLLKVLERGAVWISVILLFSLMLAIMIPGLSEWLAKKNVDINGYFLVLFGAILLIFFERLEKYRKIFNKDVEEIKSKLEVNKYFKQIVTAEDIPNYIKMIISQMTDRSDKYFVLSDALVDLDSESLNILLKADEIYKGNVTAIVNITENNRGSIEKILKKLKANNVEAIYLQDTGNVVIIGCSTNDRKEVLVLHHEGISRKLFGFYTNMPALSNRYIEMFKGLIFQSGPVAIPSVRISNDEVVRMTLRTRQYLIKSLEDTAKGFYTIPNREKLYEELAQISYSAKNIHIVDYIPITEWDRNIQSHTLPSYVEVQFDRCKNKKLALERIHTITIDEEKDFKNNISKYDSFKELHENNSISVRFVTHTDCNNILENFGCVIIDNSSIITDKSPKTLDEYALLSYNVSDVKGYIEKYKLIKKKAKTLDQIKELYHLEGA